VGGLAGRGEPGESKFFLSEEDRLLQVWSGGYAKALRTVAGVAHRRRVPVLNRLAVQLIGRMQRWAEWRRLQRRIPLLEFDEVIDGQRETIYTTRRQILDGRDDHLHERMLSTLHEVIAQATARHCPQDLRPAQWDLDGLITALSEAYPTGLRSQDIDPGAIDPMALRSLLTSDAERAYNARQAELSAEIFVELERAVLLNVLDRNWRAHLHELAALFDALESRSTDRSEALAGYRQQASDLFHNRQERIRRQSVTYVFKARVQAAGPT
jgi:preprotein translocase subunit SecA